MTIIDIPRVLGTSGREYEWHLRSDVCAYCRRAGRAGTVDHIVARACGGRSQGWRNKTGSCPACNSEKSDRSLLMFLLDRAERNVHTGS